MTMVLRRGAQGAQDHGPEQCAEPIILRINFVLAHPCRRGKYAGRKLTPAVALTRNDDNREVQSTEKEEVKNEKIESRGIKGAACKLPWSAP